MKMMQKKRKYGVTTLSNEDFLTQLRAALSEKGDESYAEKQRAYMKHHFNFFGLNACAWLDIVHTFLAKNGMPSTENLPDFVALCFSEEYRELHYAALETLQIAIQKHHETQENWIELLENLVQTQSWWDSVDWLAKHIALYFQQFTYLEKTKVNEWIDHPDMWLRRIAITYQRYYKSQTDADQLFRFILKTAHEREFFIQKAGGWALREYARVNPEAVRNFVETNAAQLSNLTQREAMKHLNKLK